MYYKLDKNGRIIYCSVVESEGSILLEEPTFSNAKWNGDNWVLDDEKQQQIDSSLLQKELIDIDLSSIRSIREYISSLETCPKQLKDYEKKAKEKRKPITEFYKKIKLNEKK